MEEIKNFSVQTEPTLDSTLKPALEPFKDQKKKKITPLILTIFLAVFFGFVLSRLLPFPESQTRSSSSQETAVPQDVIDPENIKKADDLEVGKTYGDVDQAFKDTAQGILKKNGLETEGTHQLLRDDRADQTVHLLSSVLDLDLFDGREVEVWGETFDSQKAGWLMDVGLVKVLN